MIGQKADEDSTSDGREVKKGDEEGGIEGGEVEEVGGVGWKREKSAVISLKTMDWRIHSSWKA